MVSQRWWAGRRSLRAGSRQPDQMRAAAEIRFHSYFNSWIINCMFKCAINFESQCVLKCLKCQCILEEVLPEFRVPV